MDFKKISDYTQRVMNMKLIHPIASAQYGEWSYFNWLKRSFENEMPVEKGYLYAYGRK